MESDVIEQKSEAEEQKPSEKKRHHLEALMVGKKRFAYADKILYRVYDKADHFQLVEADSAAEAFTKSGLGHAVKIQREAFFHYVALDKDAITDSDEVIEVDVELPTEAEKALFLDAALVNEAIEKSKRHFESVEIGGLYQKAPKKDQPNEEAEPALQQEQKATPPDDGVATKVEAEKAATEDEAEEPADSDEALSPVEINSLLAAQED